MEIHPLATNLTAGASGIFCKVILDQAVTVQWLG